MNSIKKVFVTLLMINCALLSAQHTYQLKVDTSEVPLKVKEAFQAQYSSTLVKAWYVTHISYWYGDYANGIYIDWYGYRTVVLNKFEKPNYYVAEFTGEVGETSKALYNRYGFWYETRTQVKGFPFKVVEAINNTPFATWKRSIYKEKLESADWPIPVYRFKVSKGLKSLILRFDEDGNLIQSRELQGDH